VLCVGGAETVVPWAVTLQVVVAFTIENRSRIGASGTCGAGTVVIVCRHAALTVTEIQLSPTK
jgi:hypothetical protein